MKLKSAENKVNPFSLAHYTEGERVVSKRQDESKERVEEFFKEMYDQSTAWVTVANVMIVHHSIYTGWAETFEQAWSALGYDITSDIIYRAASGLSAKKQERRG